MLFDTHTHYFDEKFGSLEEQNEILTEVLKNVPRIVICGTNPTTSCAALNLAEKHGGVYAACGLHPEDISDKPDENDFMLIEIEKYFSHPKCVAIGEIGLDYYWRSDNREEQKRVFRKQLGFAKKHDLPVVVHDRDAHGDSLDTVRSFPDIIGVFHSFSGSCETAAELVRLGWYISFSGVITFKNAVRVSEVAKNVPENRLMIETDCPYLSPVPHRGERNDSRNLIFIAEKIAELRGESVDETVSRTSENAMRLFNRIKCT